MKHIFKCVVIFSILLNYTQLKAQTNPLNFTIESKSLYTSGKLIDNLSTIKKTDHSLVWTQNNRSAPVIMDFKIVDLDEIWNSETSTGTVTYNMFIDGYEGEFTMSGNATGLTMKIEVKITNTEKEIYIFNVETITYI